MLLSGFKSLDVQPFLWEEPLRGHGHVRVVIGALTERLTAKLLSGRRHKTDSTSDYCPDVSRIVGGKIEYFESKACGLSSQIFIYEGRLEKDAAFVAAGGDLKYVIWHHGATTKIARTVCRLETLVLKKMRAVYIVPFSDIAYICSFIQPEKLNSEYGPGGDTYGGGYRISLSKLRPFLFDKWKDQIR